MITQRSVTQGSGQFPAYGAWTEAENVLIDCVEADLVHLALPIEDPRIRSRRQAGRLARRVLGPDTALPPSFGALAARRPLTGRYDIAIFMAHSIWDLQLLERLGRIRKWAASVAVWFMETWPSSYVSGAIAAEPFHCVDHIFVGMDAAVEPLAEAINRPVEYLPMATDTLRFGPERPDDERPIDLIGIGRRRAEQHHGMLRWAADTGRFYLYDTIKVGRPPDIETHRNTIGGWYRNSKLATCNYAKNDERDIVDNHRVMPGRLWEGLAAGTGLVGIPPNELSQHDLFGRTVVEPLPHHPADLPAFLDEQIARHGHDEVSAHVRTALYGHDWAHRWAVMLDQVGLAPASGLENRISDLADRAEKFA